MGRLGEPSLPAVLDSLHGHAADFREGSDLGGSEDFFDLGGLVDAVVAQNFEALVVIHRSFLEGAVGLSDELKAANADFLDFSDLRSGETELFLHLRRKNHRVAEHPVLDFVEAIQLRWREHGKGLGVVEVDHREEPLISS